MVGWNFDIATANPALVPKMIAYVKPVELKSGDSTGRYIQLEKGWVRRQLKDGAGNVIAATDPGNDWMIQLASRIADRWTISKHLIDAIRSQVAIPDFKEYWQLIAVALRDRAGLGLIDTTDGNGLLRYAIQLAVPISQDSWFENLVRDGALRTLQARMVEAESVCDLIKWLKELTNIEQIPQALRNSLFDKDGNVNNELPKRTLTLTWPANDPGVPHVLAGASPPPVTISVFARRDGTAGIANGELLRVDNVIGTREKGLDGSVSLIFDVYEQLAKVPLPAGFFEAEVKNGGTSFPSTRIFVPPTVMDDIAPLARLCTALSDNKVLSPLIYSGWNARATRGFEVEPSKNTSPWFSTVLTNVADDAPTYTVSSEWIGDIRPFDGRTWVVTLGNIVRQAAGAGFTLEFSGPYKPDGEAELTAAALTLRIESLAGSPNLQLTLALKGTALQHQNSIDVPANFHIRIELGRQNLSAMSAEVFVGHGDPDSGNPVTWLTGASIVKLTGLEEPKLRRLGLRILNGTATLNSIAPTLLTAPRSLFNSGLEELRNLWDTSMNPASQLWRKSQEAKLEEKLSQYDLVTKLARGQTARLEPVWFRQLRLDNPNYIGYRTYLRQQIKKMLRSLPNDRFDRSTGAKAKSIYRDFFPEVSAQGITNELWDLVVRQFDFAAEIPLPPEFKDGQADLFKEQEADVYPTPMPHAMNLEVDRPGMFTDTTADGEDADLLMNLRGFGVMLRQANPTAPANVDPLTYFSNQPWQLLTSVDVGVLDSPTPQYPKLENYKIDVDFGMLSGDLPLQYQNLSRQTSIAYQNRHLGAVSPLTEIAEEFEFGSDGLRTQPSPLMRKKPAKLAVGTTYDWGILPTLKFGQLYQVFPFVIGNCGNMPTLLTGDQGHPAQLRTTKIADPEWNADAREQIRSLKYLRRVGIGPVRLGRVNGEEFNSDGKRKTLPEVPEGVRPLANEWEIQGLTSAQREMRYAYDRSRLCGEIGQVGKLLDNWAIVVPRVFIAGANNDEFVAPEIAFNLDIGLRTHTDACVLKVERKGKSVKVNGQEVVQLESSGQGPVLGGPLDLCVVCAKDRGSNTSKVRLAWRQSDRQEPWISTDTAIVAASAIQGPAWVSITRNAAAGLDPEATLTYAVPRFSAGMVDLDAFLVDERQLDVRPLAAPDRAVVVFKSGKDKVLTFGLRPPATDLETWTAWFDMDLIQLTNPVQQQAAKDLRLATWTYHKLWSVPVPEGATANPDSTTDDFAVDMLLIEMVPLHIDSTPYNDYPRTIEKRLQIPWKVTRPVSDGKMATVQSLAREFELHVKSFVDPDRVPEILRDPEIANLYNSITPRLKDGNPILIRILEKEIWELRVYPAIREEYFTQSNKPGAQRFHSRFGEGEKWNNAGVDYRLFKPWRLVLEGATDEVVTPRTRTKDKKIDEREGRRLLLESLHPRFAAGLVTVEQIKNHPMTFRYAAQIRLQRQVWRWQGRPTPPFPFDATETPQIFDSSPDGQLSAAELEAPSLVSLWDAAGFGARSNHDLLEEVRPIVVDQFREILFREDLNGDRRSLYYRFSQLAISRYAGIYLNPPTVQAVEGIDNAQNPWRRLLTPCRFDRDVPRPPVRFITPLTQSEEDQAVGGVPGLLVVLDDAWYAYGGLAEALEAEIVEVSDYWDTAGGSAPVKRPEFSPSPTHTGRAWIKRDVGEGADDSPPTRALPMELVGPIGHTFDTDADSPLFNASSFVLRPPAVRGVNLPNGSTESLDWYFAKIRFRRVLIPEACDGYRWQTPLPLLGEQSASLTLDGSQAWVVDAAQTVLEFNGIAAELTVKVGALGRLVLAMTNGQALSVRWAPVDPKALRCEQTYNVVDALANTKFYVDVRVLLQLDARTGDQSAPTSPPPRHLTVQVRVRSVVDAASNIRKMTDQPQRVWRNAGTLTWDGIDWPTDWRLTVTGSVSSTLPAAYPARLSAFTSPSWVQFLPDGDLLSLLLKSLKQGQDTDAPGIRVPTLNWLNGTLPAEWTLRNSEDKDLTDLLPLGIPIESSQNSDITVFRCVILTELIADVRGQSGQELYLGLYKRYKRPDNLWAMQEVHKSVDLSAIDNRGDKPPRKLRVRAIEFELVNLKDSVFKDDFAKAPLDYLFAHAEKSVNNDEQARIVRTSPPVEVVERVK
jgi:hypothetical protein